MPVKLTCLTCEKEYFVDPYRLEENPKYCSKKCFLEKWSNRHTFNCKNCGKEETAFGYTKGRKKYCSKKCMNEFRHTPLEELVKKSIEKQENGCWNWTSSIATKTGYGKLVFGGKDISAHRASYTVFKGEIPKGKHVCHTCDNKKCVNPEHLWVGTAKENMQDKISKGRSPKYNLKNRKHSDELIQEILKLRNEGKTYAEIYKITKVPIGTACAYVNNHRRNSVSP